MIFIYFKTNQCEGKPSDRLKIQTGVECSNWLDVFDMLNV